MKNFTFKIIEVIFLSLLLIAIACNNDDNDGLWADITVNEGPDGDIGGDFTGNGGDATRIINWSNSLTTADYNADITAPKGSTFQMVVQDADGKVVLDRSLQGGSEPDSFSGVTNSGTSGMWTVTIILTNFVGDGSYSLSEGD